MISPLAFAKESRSGALRVETSFGELRMSVPHEIFRHCSTVELRLRQLIRQRVTVVSSEGIVSIEVFLWSAVE